ncbi:MAG: hypothetical protein K0R62_5828 [Nonomuraea muscovyensis]|nr:hypothetical protein [Nonomuraea muscovyensis]
MRRALSAAIIALAAFGGTAAMSAPAFAASTSGDEPIVITSDQLTPRECRDLVVYEDGERRVVHHRAGHDDCRPYRKVRCGTELVDHRTAGRWEVRFRDRNGVVHTRAFRHRADADRFVVRNARVAKKDRHVVRWVGCSHR